MHRLQPHSKPSRHTPSPADGGRFYRLHSDGGCLYSVLYRVVPAGRNFFHILEVPSGRIKGFRSGHSQACELAKKLEDLLYASSLWASGLAFDHLHDFTAPSTCNNCHTEPSIELFPS